jgi:hypothetical protein
VADDGPCNPLTASLRYFGCESVPVTSNRDAMLRRVAGRAADLGVLLDTIIVRAVLVTALNLDIGPRMWWPSALARTDGSSPRGRRQARTDDVLVG